MGRARGLLRAPLRPFGRRDRRRPARRLARRAVGPTATALLIRLVDELHEQATVSDALWSRAASASASDEQLIELITLAGFYHTISFVTNALAIPLEDSAERFPVDRGSLTLRSTGERALPR